MGKRCALKPLSSQAVTSAEYFDDFQSLARWDRSSRGTNMMTVFVYRKSITTSGRKDVTATSGGNCNCSSKSKNNTQLLA